MVTYNIIILYGTGFKNKSAAYGVYLNELEMVWAGETLSKDFANVDGIFRCWEEFEQDSDSPKSGRGLLPFHDDNIVKHKNPMKTKCSSKI